MKPKQHPHVVKLYGFHPDKLNDPTEKPWGLLETKEFPSKNAAEKYASRMKLESYVTSASVLPLGAPTGRAKA